MRFINILKVTVKFLLNRKAMVLLVLLVSIISFTLIDQLSTNVFQAIYHRIEIENALRYENERTYKLDFPYMEETNEFTAKANQLVSYVNTLEGVKGCGYYDFTGLYFNELKENSGYIEKNKELYKGTPYEDVPEESHILFVDAGISDLCKINIITGSSDFRSYDGSDALPMLIGYEYKDVLPIGTELTMDDSGTKYKVIGVIAKDSEWLGDVDILGSSMKKLDDKFVALYDPKLKNDEMAVLSSLNTCFYIIQDGADAEKINNAILSKAKELGLGVLCKSMETLLDEYQAPYQEMLNDAILLAALFAFFSILTVSSSEVVSILFRKPEYGIMYANGVSTGDIIKMIILENTCINAVALIISYGFRSYQLLGHGGPFRDIMLDIHKDLTLVCLLGVAAIIVAISCIVPIMMIRKLKPVELIGGRE